MFFHSNTLFIQDKESKIEAEIITAVIVKPRIFFDGENDFDKENVDSARGSTCYTAGETMSLSSEKNRTQ